MIGNPSYITLRAGPPVASTIDVNGRGEVFVDLAADGSIIGIELLVDARVTSQKLVGDDFLLPDEE